MERLKKAVREYGVPGLLREIRKRSRKRWHAYLDRHFDRVHRTDTSGTLDVRGLTLAGDPTDGIWYQPISVKTLVGLIAQLPITRSQYTFIDFGSGKGRPVLVASKLGFRRAIGVEYARELHEVAQRNIGIFRARYPDAAPIESVFCDARNYSIPDEPCVFFFFSPFRFAVMADVLANIKSSVESTNRRPAAILFVGHNHDTIAQMQALGWTECPVTTPKDFRSDESWLAKAFLFDGGTRNEHAVTTER